MRIFVKKIDPAWRWPPPHLSTTDYVGAYKDYNVLCAIRET